MITREHYIKPIRDFYNSDLIKVITGIRRCGKSVILRQIMDELVKDGKQCIFLDFELKPVKDAIPDADALIQYIEENRTSDKCYLFLDEIQNVKEWNEACRTLRLQNNSVFISGSNSKLLSREFTEKLSGRYVSFRIRPFVYQEANLYAKQIGIDYSITDYMIWGGFPASIPLSVEGKKRYFSDLNETIVYNDLEKRYGIRKTEIFEKVVDFILASNARIASAQAISDYMKEQNISVSVPTIIKYLSYLKEAYVIQEISQYSMKTKNKMSFYQKLYDEDVSMNSIRAISNKYDLSHNLENIVLNELLYKGYDVTVFNNSGKEIDFRAEKDNKVFLIQVAYSVVEDKAYKREFDAFANLDYSMKKILITNDDIDYSTSTVYHYKLKDFLFMNEL